MLCGCHAGSVLLAPRNGLGGPVEKSWRRRRRRGPQNTIDCDGGRLLVLLAVLLSCRQCHCKRLVRAVVRDRVLAGVAELLAEGRDLTYANVAAASAVAERTVYRHFPARQDLMTAVVEWVNQRAGTQRATTGEDARGDGAPPVHDLRRGRSCRPGAPPGAGGAGCPAPRQRRPSRRRAGGRRPRRPGSRCHDPAAGGGRRADAHQRRGVANAPRLLGHGRSRGGGNGGRRLVDAARRRRAIPGSRRMLETDWSAKGPE